MYPTTYVRLPGKIPFHAYVHTFITEGTYRGFTGIHILRRKCAYLSCIYRTRAFTYTKQGDIAILRKHARCAVIISSAGIHVSTYKGITVVHKFRLVLYDLCSRAMFILPGITWKGTPSTPFLYDTYSFWRNLTNTKTDVKV